MSFIVAGLSHKTAPVDLRERLALPAKDMPSVLERLASACPFKEAVLLSTCNRFEIYGHLAKDSKQAMAPIKTFFQGFYPGAALQEALYHWNGKEAVRHLFRVAAGLDSLVIGETEILGQVKSAYLLAQSRNTTGKITNVLFQRALYVGKQVRATTRISEGASSVGSVAVQLAERIFGALNQHRVLILGAGKMAEVTTRHLLSQKVGEIVILNRTVSKAEELARQLKGRSGPLERLQEELINADIVIGSVISERPIITRGMVQSILKSRRGRSLYFIDIAVPRNVEADVHGLENVYVYNIDDLKSLVEENLAARKSEVHAAERMVDLAAQESHAWMEAAFEGKMKALRHNWDSVHG